MTLIAITHKDKDKNTKIRIQIHTTMFMRKLFLSSECKYVCPTSADWRCYEMRRPDPTLSKWRSTHVKFYLREIKYTNKKIHQIQIYAKDIPPPSLSDAQHMSNSIYSISDTQKYSTITDIHIKYTPTPSLLTSDARQMSNFIFYSISNTQIEVHQIQIWKCLLHKTCFVQ